MWGRGRGKPLPLGIWDMGYREKRLRGTMGRVKPPGAQGLVGLHLAFQ